MNRALHLLPALLVACLSLTAADKKIAAGLEQIEDDPKLPRIMLIGDSISMGYTPVVREMLKGKANIHHPPENCSDSGKGVKSLEKWLGDTKWDVIHFNFGLHDLKYTDATGKLVTPDKGKLVNLTDAYEKNLRDIVAKLKTTGAKIIFCKTTPVPDGSQGRIKDSELAYNEVAEKVMKDSSIDVDDLHAIIKAKPELQLPKNVHFTPEGSKALATEVVKHLESALKK